MCRVMLLRMCLIPEDVRSLALPGTYHEKIGVLGDGLRYFTRLKALDLSRNALESLKVTVDFVIKISNCVRSCGCQMLMISPEWGSSVEY